MGKVMKMGTLALIGAGAYLFLKGKGGAGAVVDASGGRKVRLMMKPGAVKAGEEVTIKNYRVISSPRPNMALAPVTGGAVGASGMELKVGPMPKSGQLTRNLVQQGGQYFAEIA